MPDWKTHNKWAVKCGIDVHVSNWVNKREDLPKLETCNDAKLEAFRETIPDVQPDYKEMADMGEEYLKAWMLHILLDEIRDISKWEINENEIEELDNRKLHDEVQKSLWYGSELIRLAPNELLAFIKENFIEIVDDIVTDKFVNDCASERFYSLSLN